MLLLCRKKIKKKKEKIKGRRDWELVCSYYTLLCGYTTILLLIMRR